MSDDMRTEAELKLNVSIDKNANKLLDFLGELGTDGEAASRTVLNIKKDVDQLVTSMRRGGAEASSYADDFGKLVKRLQDFQKAQRAAAQSGVVGGSLDGKNRAELENLSTQELKEYIAVDDARGQNAVAVARTIVNEREREAQRSISLRQQEDQVYNRLLAEQTAGRKKATDEAIAQIEREHQAYVSAYSTQYANASASDSAAASAQQSKRYATPTPASRNTANPYDQAAAQAEYATQATKEYSAAVKERVDAANRQMASLHAEALAENAARDARQKGTESLISQRYALYDVATTYGIVAAAATAATVGVVSTAADYESAFTQVERTSIDSSGHVSAAVEGLKQKFVDLSTQIPVSFEDLTSIASLGAQLGIPEAALESFTTTVSKFSAVTNVSVDDAAQSFGALGSLMKVSSADYDRMGSAIAQVGVNSVATESEILSVSQQIASYTTLAGYSAQETIGLSGALASLRVPPEQARSAIQTLFNTINTATAKGGKDMDNFASVLGMTADQAAALYKSDPSAFVDKFVGSLSHLDSQQLTLTLDALGLSEKRTATVLTKLAGNTNILQQSQSDANEAWASGTFLTNAYGLVADDLNSKLMELGSAVTGLVAAIGGSASGMGVLVQQIILVVNGLRDIVNNPAAAVFVRIGITLLGAVAAFAAFRAASALATASTYALVTAQESLAKSGAAGGIRGLATAMLGLNGAARGAATGTAAAATGAAAAGRASAGAATGVNKLSLGLRSLGRATIIIALLQAAADLVFDFSGSMQNLGNVLDWARDRFNGAIQGIVDFVSTLTKALGFLGNGFGAFGGQLEAVARTAGGMLKKMNNDAANGFNKWADSLQTSTDASGGAADALYGLADAGDDAGSGFQGLSDDAAGAAAEIRTLEDYANDLSTVMKRAFDIRYGGDQALDTITSGWQKIAQASADAQAAMAKANATLQQLASDKSIDEYWLSVANMYGDTLRAAKIQADLAQNAVDTKSAQDDLTKAQNDNSKTLVGNSEAAIANRETITGLLGNYESLIQAYAASGMSQEELAVKAQQLRADFIQQATQLGFNQTELQKYASAFDDVAIAIARVPRNITVTANTNPAIQALNELDARARQIGSTTYAGPNFDTGGVAKGARLVALQAEQQMLLKSLGQTGSSISPQYATNRINQISAAINSGNYWDGGYTGAGGKYDYAGAVHKGEFVFSAAATRNIGVENLAYAHQAARSGSPFSLGSGGGAPQGLMELGPATIAAIADAVAQIRVVIPGQAIARATNANNVNSSNRGSGG